jgi:hypothetical protein
MPRQRFRWRKVYGVRTKRSSRPGRRGRSLSRVVVALGLLTGASGVGGGMAWAQTASQQVVAFNIPQQPLATALDSFSATTGVVGLYQARLAMGRVSKPVNGQFTPGVALALLLDDTGLEAEYAAAAAFVLVPAHGTLSNRVAGAVAQAALAPQDMTQRGYSALLQARINDALCAGTVTRPGEYRVALNFRVGADGVIQNFGLLGSSGDAQRDEAIAQALRALPVGRAAPAHMPQPFTMVVLPTSSGGAIDCHSVKSARRDD